MRSERHATGRNRFPREEERRRKPLLPAQSCRDRYFCDEHEGEGRQDCKAENFERMLDEVVWRITLLATPLELIAMNLQSWKRWLKGQTDLLWGDPAGMAGARGLAYAAALASCQTKFSLLIIIHPIEAESIEILFEYAKGTLLVRDMNAAWV